MLQNALEALGSTYTGYKGGDYLMTEYTSCYIANYGECGEEIGPILLSYMLDDNESGYIQKEENRLIERLEKVKLDKEIYPDRDEQIHQSLGVNIPEENLLHKKEINISQPVNDDTTIKYSK
jgi:hypothetical protein